MWQSIGLTLLLLLGHTLIRRLIHKSLLALGQSRHCLLYTSDAADELT